MVGVNQKLKHKEERVLKNTAIEVARKKLMKKWNAVLRHHDNSKSSSAIDKQITATPTVATVETQGKLQIFTLLISRGF